MHGDWQDWLVHPDGTRTLRDAGRNLIVSNAYVLQALGMLGLGLGATAPAGALYWAVGDGGVGLVGQPADSATWDAQIAAGTLKPTAADTGLVRETFRKLITPADLTFVDAQGVPVATPTNRLQITVTFALNEPPGGGTLREWAIVGGIPGAATASNPTPLSGAANSGLLVNHKFHRTYAKLGTSQLQRKLVLTF